MPDARFGPLARRSTRLLHNKVAPPAPRAATPSQRATVVPLSFRQSLRPQRKHPPPKYDAAAHRNRCDKRGQRDGRNPSQQHEDPKGAG